ncbi:hypothetical protein [Paenimyroides aestuarii]|uniref:Phage protein n=1 Tax=Paenimyroides aestuarii TaxID=2968490 RepID=A0ABY5NSG0_9FLAO|nr:hypothetical protein [Paenimyroides aestuarii]UUV21424.1 hypothetical protein NPX36_14030 [Paenimyroides aestuarii]
MKVVEWKRYPQYQPEESGLYLANWKLNNIYCIILSFFDNNTKKWYDGTDREKIIDAINAFNPYKILPFA